MRGRTLVAYAVLVASVVVGVQTSGDASAVAAEAPTNLLGTHGSFEKPVVRSGPGQTYRPGALIDGWRVRKAHVSLGKKFAGLVTPPRGRQYLVLVNARDVGVQSPGAVCRTISTMVGNRYKISFLGGVVTSGRARLVVRLGTRSVSTARQPGRVPVAWTPYDVTLRSSEANAELCLTAAHVTSEAYPVVDAVEVVDLGP